MLATNTSHTALLLLLSSKKFFFCQSSFVFPRVSLPNQKFSWEHSGIKVGNVCNLLIIVGIMAGICCVYWGKLPTMRLTIYSCLWWDNPTSSPNNVGTSHALPRSFPSIYLWCNNGVSIENPLLFAYLILLCYLPTLYPFIFAYPNPYSPITCLP